MDLFSGFALSSSASPCAADLDRWLALRAAEANPLRPHSVAVYRTMWRAVVSYCVARDLDWVDLDGAAVQRFVAERNIQPQQERRYLSLISGVAQAIGEDGARAVAACRQLGHLDGRAFAFARENRGVPVVLPPAALRAVVTTLIRWVRSDDWRTQRDAALFASLVGAGLKPGESAGLDCAAAISEPARGVPYKLVVAGHGPTPPRETPIAYWAALILARWLRARVRLDLPGWRLFPNGSDDNALDASTLSRRFELLARQSGLDPNDLRGSSHVLRHTWVMRQLANGADPQQLRQWLGFTSAAAMEPYLRVVGAPAAVI